MSNATQFTLFILSSVGISVPLTFLVIIFALGYVELKEKMKDELEFKDLSKIVFAAYVPVLLISSLIMYTILSVGGA